MQKEGNIPTWLIVPVTVLIVLSFVYIFSRILPSSIEKSINNQLSIDKINPKVKIEFPKGGEVFRRGAEIQIKWSGGEDLIHIFLIDKVLEEKGVSDSTADRIYDLKNKGSFNYKIPDKLPSSTYKFEIGDGDSGYFKIGG